MMQKLMPGVRKVVLLAGMGLLLTNGYAQQLTRNNKDNTIRTITYPEGTGLSKDNLQSSLIKLLELGSGHQFVLKFSNNQKNGSVIVRYTQQYQGITVEHGSAATLVVGGKVSYIHANVFKPAVLLSATPVLTEEQALQQALNYIHAREYMWEHVTPSKLTSTPDYKYPKGTLVWVQDFIQTDRDKQLHLAYKFDIHAKQPLSRDLIYVDATTGKVLLKDAVLKHVGGTGVSLYSGTVSMEVANTSPNTYEMYDSIRNVETYDLGGGTNLGFATLVSSSTTSFAKHTGVDAHWGAEKVYDYWLTEHSRNSFDNFGTTLSSVVNYDLGYNNAFWNGYYMTYGNGTGMFASGIDPLVAIDVCAHEVGHGVCQHTAGLIYEKESGALNEGFSDIWGATIEQYAAPGKSMWTMGEEIRTGALRSMSNPNAFDDPDTRGGTHWVDVISCIPTGGIGGNDYCGVHTNSGVLNHWFYLMVVGGKGTNDLNNQYEVAPLGIKKAAQIAYATEQMLGSTDGFDDCRQASIAITASIFGGNCSREVETVTRAWRAVGVGNAFVPCAPQLGFAIGDTTISKVVAGAACPNSKSITIPLRVTGNAPMGGNATVTITGTGTAISGADYAIPANIVTFNAGSTASQNVNITIIDNGDVTGDKILKLYATVTPNGSNATLSYTFDSCFIRITGSRSLPDTGGDISRKSTTPDVKSKAVTPFFSRNRLGRSQFIITAKELAGAGVKPNVNINTIQFNVTEKNSTQAFTNLKVKIETTALTDLTGGNPTVTTVYFNSNFTTQLGINSLSLSTPLVWNGTDNLVFETCFANATIGTENDYIEAVVTKTPATSIAYSDAGTDGCTLPFSSGFYFYSISKPVVRFVQTAPVTQAEKIVCASKPWEVNPGQSVYFYNDTNSKVMTNITNSSQVLGCVTSFIMKQGAGFNALSAPYAATKRSAKEFALIPLQNAATSAYTLILFFDTSEIGAANLANVRILATSSPDDTSMTTYNTELVTPTVVQGKGMYAFSGNFTGFKQKYFLIDDNITLPSSVKDIVKNKGNISVVNNPFTDRIYLHYNVMADTKAEVRLLDITGKVVYNTSADMQAQHHQLELNINDRYLITGNYILQVITPAEVFTTKLVKQ